MPRHATIAPSSAEPTIEQPLRDDAGRRTARRRLRDGAAHAARGGEAEHRGGGERGGGEQDRDHWFEQLRGDRAEDHHEQRRQHEKRHGDDHLDGNLRGELFRARDAAVARLLGELVEQRRDVAAEALGLNQRGHQRREVDVLHAARHGGERVGARHTDADVGERHAELVGERAFHAGDRDGERAVERGAGLDGRGHDVEQVGEPPRDVRFAAARRRVQHERRQHETQREPAAAHDRDVHQRHLRQLRAERAQRADPDREADAPHGEGDDRRGVPAGFGEARAERGALLLVDKRADDLAAALGCRRPARVPARRAGAPCRRRGRAARSPGRTARRS